jgi:hypothetical protein
LPQSPAGILGVTGHQPGHVNFSITGREIVLGLIVIVAVIILLTVPILWGALSDVACAGIDRATTGMFVLGVGILLVGLISGLRVLDIAGGGMLGAWLLGVIVANYLIRALAATNRGASIIGVDLDEASRR